MNTESLNDILQLAGVFIALTICVVYVVRKIINRRKSKSCEKDSCGGCPLADSCKGHHSTGSCGCS